MSQTGAASGDFSHAICRAAAREGLRLSETQIGVLAVHFRLLQVWGRRMNLTSITHLEEVVNRHFMEGLLAGEVLRRSGFSGSLLDLGSGNGFPAFPLRVACPAARPLILVESSGKRAGFLRALIREVEWRDASVEVRRVARGRDLSDLPCDLFTTRGVSPFRLLKEGLPFLRSGGIALLFMTEFTLETEIPVLPKSLRLEACVPLPGRESG